MFRQAEARAFGGDVMIRAAALENVGGYRDDLIAGEEPELCIRLRAAGWRIWRLPYEMTSHDAAMTRFSQWWRRAMRAGYAFAQGAHLHGASPERHWVWESRRAWLWAAMAAARMPDHERGFLAVGPADVAHLSFADPAPDAS